jgi:Ca2+ transporting ATPase
MLVRMRIPAEDSEDFRAELERDLIYLATFGLDDPLHADVVESITYIAYGHPDNKDKIQAQSAAKKSVTIRMVSGDHYQTARAVAYASGILDASEGNIDEKSAIMEGDEFRAAIGNYEEKWDPKRGCFYIDFENIAHFAAVKKKLRVLARATAEDKFILVSGIRGKQGIIGMTGEGITDAKALSCANVGLCMGSGCDVAKDSADLVIRDNRFQSIHRSMQWGLAVFNNVRKFMQFQLTINIVICTITIVGGATVGHNPLNVIQMLWTNLIMDILGAIALGTEKYEEGGKFARVGRGNPKVLVLEQNWRQIIVQAFFQIFVMFMMMFLGAQIFFAGKSINLITAKSHVLDDNGDL